MVRSYLRHGETNVFGLIASASSQSLFDGSLAFCPALEDVLVWNVKKGEQVAMWHETGLRALVTCLARHPDGERFAVGYADGSIRVWSAVTKSVNVTFDGHRRGITTLTFDATGTKLASGSQDSDIIVWDVVGEAGLFRLRGHRDQITGLAFLSGPSPEPTHLVSLSKEALLKLWHLPTQHCLDTAIVHRVECWTLAVLPRSEDDPTDEAVVLTGGSEGELRLFGLSLAPKPRLRESGSDQRVEDWRCISPIGSVKLSSSTHTQRVPFVTVHPTLPLLAVQTSEKNVEICRIRSADEARRKRRRRDRREREKAAARGKELAVLDDGDEQLSWVERITNWQLVNPGSKVRSVAFATGLAPVNRRAKRKGRSQDLGDQHILLALSNNSFETWSLPPLGASKQQLAAQAPMRLHAIRLPGHRADIRAVAVSSDDALLASVSNGELKIWNRRTGKCLRTMDTGYALCCQWLPGDKHVLVGTKAGDVSLFDIAGSRLLESIHAHSGPVWSLHVRPDGKGFVTGSADKDVKFFDFEVREHYVGESEAAARALTARHVKTLKMTDDVLAIRYSPDGRLLAMSLLDSTVKVFFSDTLKFFLSLYGHKLPVLSMDISSDSKLIVTCSADKNVKIWGLDFGDCHRSIFAHDDSITQVVFEKNSHYFWSVGKDKLLKYWDGDKFQQIQRIVGHQGEIWALAVSHRGRFVTTGAADRSIRIIEKTEEPLFLEEERERELEAVLDANQPVNEPFDLLAREKGESAEAGTVSKATQESITSGERIMEALAVSDAERARQQEPASTRPAQNPLLAASGCSAELYVFNAVRRVQPSALEDALLVLSFPQVGSLLYHLDIWVLNGWHLSLSCRILALLLRTYYSQLVATRTLRECLFHLREHLRRALEAQKDTIGYNLAALHFLKRQHDLRKTAEFYERDATGDMTEEAARAKLIELGAKRKRAIVK